MTRPADPRAPGWSLRRLAPVAALFALLTLALTYPLSVRPHDHVLANDPDNHLFIWTLAWNTHALTTNPVGVFDANIYHPQRLTLAYSENLIGSTLFAAPVIWLTGNPVLAMNVVALLSVFFCGLGAFLLARQLGLGLPAAILCGIVFAFAPSRLFRTSQIHLGPVQWIPFALAFLHAYFDGGRRRDLRLALAFFTLQVWTSGHAGVFATLALGMLAAWKVVMGAPLAPLARLRDAGVIGALLLGVNVLLFVPYRIVQQEMGLRRTLENWGTTPESFLASPTHLHAALLARVAPHVNEVAWAYLFPGYLAYALALLAVVWRWRRGQQVARFAPGRWPHETGFYVLLTLACFLLAVGPPLSIWPLVYWLPGLNFIRGPSRFMILGVLGVAVLSAIGFQRLSDALAPNRRTLAAGLAAAIFLAECAAIPLHVVPFRVRLHAADRWLARQPRPFVVAEFPVRPWARYHSTYMLHSMAHWQKTVHGYSGFQAPLHDTLYGEMRSFPDEQSLESLRRLGVRYAVVHADMYPPDDWPAVEARLAAFAPQLERVYSAGAGRVYALRAR